MISAEKLSTWRWSYNQARLYVFMKLLVKANQEDKEFETGIIKRGQLVFTYGKLSAELSVPLQTLRTVLRDLQKTGDILIYPTRKWSYLTICEYDSWQSDNDEANMVDGTIDDTQQVLQSSRAEILRLKNIINNLNEQIENINKEKEKLKEELANASEKKEKKEKAVAKDNTGQRSERYDKFLKFLKKKTPYCYEHMKLPTEVEFYKLIDKYDPAMVAEIAEQIENRKDLRKTYTNLYRTLLNWLDNEMKRRNGAVI